MTERIIQLVQQSSGHVPLNFDVQQNNRLPVKDHLNRSLNDLRISVTDQCNFRCVYCMAKSIFDQNHSFLPKKDLLSFEEIERITNQFVKLGVEKIRLTGGEPLLRKNIEVLIARLSKLQTPSGNPAEITLTTNATLLRSKARALKEAGLNRLTVSLDALDDIVFKTMNDVDFAVDEVLDGIKAAHDAGFGTIKINMVVKKGMNDHQVLPMARYFKNTPHIVRFIEYMDVGSSNGWKMEEVVPSARIINMISQGLAPLQAVEANYTGEVAARWKYKDGSNEIGVISSVTNAFCQDCTRIRLSTEGKIYTCLFASKGHDLKPLLRSGADAEEINTHLNNALCNLWALRTDNYSQTRNQNTIQPSDRIEMSYIGG